MGCIKDAGGFCKQMFLALGNLVRLKLIIMVPEMTFFRTTTLDDILSE